MKSEKPTPLGDRVYKKHRKMITTIKRYFHLDTRGAATRHAIEELYNSIIK